ncbi:hypothetical protein C355_06284 [Cryptococcus neoformans Th84]|nr:hypothetical protein C355_06284 [Cryptococcus neoformans var. grubii Th84]
MEPLQHKVITINVDRNTVEQRTPVIEGVNNHKKLTVVYRVITLGTIEGSRIYSVGTVGASLRSDSVR